MPSPIVHVSVGYLIYRYVRERFASWSVPSLMATGAFREVIHKLILQRWVLFGVCVFLSLLPDIDCLPAVWMGHLAWFHNGFTHSFLFAAVISVLAGLCFRLMAYIRFLPAFLLVLGSLLSHLLLDQLSHGRGQMLFWPFDVRRYKIPFDMFFGLRWSEGWVSINHLWTFLSELLFSVCVTALYILVRKKRILMERS